ncbi:hypothetical protein SCMC78_23120 [Streptomyces sp. CMC78]|uniref:Uncharacterized protein n=1 Tax=Streptomyces sp. CMC78 TaxID=3231512 RepID=A0AB33KDU0_9ACTN
MGLDHTELVFDLLGLEQFGKRGTVDLVHTALHNDETPAAAGGLDSRLHQCRVVRPQEPGN